MTDKAANGKRLKRKLDEKTTYEDLLQGWTQCCFLMVHKQRLCSVSRNPGSQYCGNHIQMVAQETNVAIAEEDIRIPCPVDPNHTIFLRNRDAHVKICNASKYSQALENLPYYCHGCNGGPAEVLETGAKVDCAALLAKVEAAYALIQFDCPAAVEGLEALNERIRSSLCGEQTAFARVRHVEQDIAIVQQLIGHGLLPLPLPLPLPSPPSSTSSPSLSSSSSSGCCYVEYGAGKGLLSAAIATASATSVPAQFVLIDRNPNRRKADRHLLGGAACSRLRMDIRHVDVSKVEQVRGAARVVGVAKHLCGSASDLAVRSLSQLHLLGGGGRYVGLAVATCCHHACSHSDYAGQRWLTQTGISADEFALLRRWSGWANVDLTKPRSTSKEVEGVQDEHAVPVEQQAGPADRPPGLTEAQLPIVGRKVKRVLDYGRVLHLRAAGMSVRYLPYCEAALSPECMLIIAHSPQEEDKEAQSPSSASSAAIGAESK